MKRIVLLSLTLLLSIQAKQEAGSLAAAKAAEEAADALAASHDAVVEEQKEHEEEIQQRQRTQSDPTSGGTVSRPTSRPRSGSLDSAPVTTGGMRKPLKGLDDATTFVASHNGDDLVEVDLTGPVMPTILAEQEGPSTAAIQKQVRTLTVSKLRFNMTRITGLFPKVRFPKFDFSAMLKSIQKAPGRAVNAMRNLASFLRRNPEAVATAVVQGNREPVITFVSATGQKFVAPLTTCAVMYADLQSILETGNVTKISQVLGIGNIGQEKAIVIKKMLDYYSSAKMKTTLDEAWDKFTETTEGKKIAESIKSNEENNLALGGKIDLQHQMREKIRYLMNAVDANGYSKYLNRNLLTFSRPGSDQLETMTADEINQYTATGEYGKAAKARAAKEAAAQEPEIAALTKRGLSKDAAKLLVQLRDKVLNDSSPLTVEEEGEYKMLEAQLGANINDIQKDGLI